MNGDAIRRLWHRVQAIVARARLLLADDAGPVQLMQVRIIGDEVKSDVPRMADYGFVSMPPAGADVVLVFLSGERSSGIVIATNHQTFRMRNLADGEVAIHDNKGRFVHLSTAGIHVQGNADPITVQTTSDITATAGGNITLQASGKIKLQAATVEIDATSLTMNASTATLTATTTITGTTAIDGDTSVTGALTNNGHAAGSTHKHAAGGLVVGSTAVTGISGTVTP